MIYLIAFIYLSSLAVVYDFGQGVKAKKFNYYAAMVLLICIAGFRYKVGGDTYNYMHAHAVMPDLSSIFNHGEYVAKNQPLWILLVATAKSISDEFFVLQFMQAVIVNVAVFSFFGKTTRYYFTAILIYSVGAFPYFNFEIMREGLAIAMFLWAFGYYRDQRWFPFCLMAGAAFLFHASAFFLALLPLFRKRQPPVFLAPVVFVIGYFLNPLFSRYIAAGGQMGDFFSYVSSYAEYNYTVYGLLSLLLLYIAYPIGLLKLSGVSSNRASALRSLALTGVWVGATTSMFFIFFRFLNYFTPIFMVLACEAVHRVYRGVGSLALRAVAAGVLSLFLFGVYTARYFKDTSDIAYATHWYNRWYPYTSVFDGVEDSKREDLRKNESP